MDKIEKEKDKQGWLIKTDSLKKNRKFTKSSSNFYKIYKYKWTMSYGRYK